MLTSQQCQTRYGAPGGPNEGAYMAIWSVPEDIQAAFAHVFFTAVGAVGFPKRIYCHKLLAPRLELALRGLMAAGLTRELKTWDGCYIVRKMRGITLLSLHSWGMAVDVNAKENPQKKKPVLPAAFVACFTRAGFDWGGAWRDPDGMHFQLQSF